MPAIFNKLKTHKKSLTVLLFLSDCLFFGLTNPAHLSLALMVAGFILVMLDIYVLLLSTRLLLTGLGYLKTPKKWVIEVMAVAIFVLVVLQSLGQLSIKDFLALIPLTALSYFYYSFTSGRGQTE
jgi:hypothetical protein